MGQLLATFLWLGGIGIVCGLALALFSKYFKVDEDPRIAKVASRLPGANCGGCGFAGCRGYAEAVVNGVAPFNKCAPGGLRTAISVANAMGSRFDGEIEQFVAVVKCSGDDASASRRFGYNGIVDCASAQAMAGGDKSCPYGCLGYGTCVRVCQSHAVEIVGGIARVHPELCTGCGTCAKACPRHVIEMMPRKSKVHVFCKSRDPGAVVRKYCTKGCLGCGLCLKNSSEGSILFEDRLARVNHSVEFDGDAAVAKCPTKCLRRDE